MWIKALLSTVSRGFTIISTWSLVRNISLGSSVDPVALHTTLNAKSPDSLVSSQFERDGGHSGNVVLYKYMVKKFKQICLFLQLFFVFATSEEADITLAALKNQQ